MSFLLENLHSKSYFTSNINAGVKYKIISDTKRTSYNNICQYLYISNCLFHSVYLYLPTHQWEPISLSFFLSFIIYSYQSISQPSCLCLFISPCLRLSLKSKLKPKKKVSLRNIRIRRRFVVFLIFKKICLVILEILKVHNSRHFDNLTIQSCLP